MQIRTCGAGLLTRGTESSGGVHLQNYEILYITEGNVSFHWRGNSCMAEAPAVFILTPSTPHEVESLSPESKYRFWELELSNTDLALFDEEQMDVWNKLQHRNDYYSKTILADAILKALDMAYHLFAIESIQKGTQLEQVCLLEIQKVFLIIAHLLDSSPKRALTAVEKRKWNEQEAIDIIIDYMDWRYKENINLESIAQLVHLNPSYLIRVFKKHKRMTPFEYLRDLRLKAALSYLSGSDMPIKVIVEQTGFNSVHYFCRLFKQTYGQSPAQWRKQIKRA